MINNDPSLMFGEKAFVEAALAAKKLSLPGISSVVILAENDILSQMNKSEPKNLKTKKPMNMSRFFGFSVFKFFSLYL